MNSWIHESDTADDCAAISEHAMADPRYQQFRAAMVHRIRAYTHSLISDTSTTDGEYHRRTTDYDLEQLRSLLRETGFLYAEARTAMATAGELGRPRAAGTAEAFPGTATTMPSHRSREFAGRWSDEFYQHPWYLVAFATMTARIRQHDLSLIDDPAVSDEEFHTRSSDFGYQQTLQLITETISTLDQANPLI